MTPRYLQWVLRNERERVTWKASRQGTRLAIEIAFDDDPDAPVRREISLKSAAPREELEALVAEQLAAGFVRLPPWEPSAEWIRDAPEDELWAEVLDAWANAAFADPSSTEKFESMPSAVKTYLALDSLFSAVHRSGLNSFLCENPLAVIELVPQAAQEAGLPEVGTLFARATKQMDLAGLANGGVRRLRYGDSKAAKELEALAGDAAPHPRLIAFVREHAEAFTGLRTLCQAETP